MEIESAKVKARTQSGGVAQLVLKGQGSTLHLCLDVRKSEGRYYPVFPGVDGVPAIRVARPIWMRIVDELQRIFRDTEPSELAERINELEGRKRFYETFVLPGMERADSLREVEFAEAEIAYLKSISLQEAGTIE